MLCKRRPQFIFDASKACIDSSRLSQKLPTALGILFRSSGLGAEKGEGEPSVCFSLFGRGSVFCRDQVIEIEDGMPDLALEVLDPGDSCAFLDCHGAEFDGPEGGVWRVGMAGPVRRFSPCPC